MAMLEELGELALGSRLRRLSDQMITDVNAVYRDRDLPFEARWFPTFSLLGDGISRTITEIAQEVGVSHPAAIQTVKELTERGLVRSRKDPQDKRRRLVTLTRRGRERHAQLEPLWAVIRLALRELVESAQVDILKSLEALESAWQERPLKDRILEHLKEKQIAEIELVEYEDGLRADFEALNREWLEEDFEVEQADLDMFARPREKILEAGGEILFARMNGQIVGTGSLLAQGDGTYELAKMGVTRACRGHQIGRKIAETLVQRARARGGRRVVLETNSRLRPAIRLYRKLGFRDASRDHPSPYARSDMYMVLDLESDEARD